MNHLISSNGTVYQAGGIAFAYSTSLTPIVSSISPNSGSGGLVKVTGTGFGTDPSLLAVKIGLSNCSIITSSDTEITCTVHATSGGVL